MIPAIGAGLVLLGVLLVATATNARSRRRIRDLRRLLDVQVLDPDGVRDAPELRAFLARSGRATERALGGSSLFARVRVALERSDWQLTPGELVAVSLGLAVAGFVVGAASLSPFLGLLLVATGLVAPYLLVVRSVNRRRAAFEEQLPDVLDLVGASLAAGSTMPAALELVVAEAEQPAAGEFARVLAATRLGQTLVEALTVMSGRLGSRDLQWTVQAIAVQQTTGGRLADILGIVASFMRSRAELRRELRALTAEGKLSAYILGGLPFVLAGFVSLTRPSYLAPLVTTLPGLVLLTGASALMGVAFVVMARIVRIEV